MVKLQHYIQKASVEEGLNQDLGQGSQIWIKENNFRKWSVGCYFVQWQKNTLHYRVIVGFQCSEAKLGLGSTFFNINTKEDLEQITELAEDEEHG